MSSFPFLAWIFIGIIIYLLIQRLINCYRWRLQHTHRLLTLLLSQLPQQQWVLITLPLSSPAHTLARPALHILAPLPLLRLCLLRRRWLLSHSGPAAAAGPSSSQPAKRLASSAAAVKAPSGSVAAALQAGRQLPLLVPPTTLTLQSGYRHFFHEAGLSASHCKSALWVCGCRLAGWPVISNLPLLMPPTILPLQSRYRHFFWSLMMR
jgi:hypothetical protein